MKLFKFPAIASDAITAGNYIWVDVSTLTEINALADTCVLKGSGWTITMTVDGDDAAEKLLNTSALAAYFAPILLEYNGTAVHRHESQKVYDVWSGLDYLGIVAATGIVKTTGTGPLVTLAVS